MINNETLFGILFLLIILLPSVLVSILFLFFFKEMRKRNKEIAIMRKLYTEKFSELSANFEDLFDVIDDQNDFEYLAKEIAENNNKILKKYTDDLYERLEKIINNNNNNNNNNKKFSDEYIEKTVNKNLYAGSLEYSSKKYTDTLSDTLPSALNSLYINNSPYKVRQEPNNEKKSDKILEGVTTEVKKESIKTDEISALEKEIIGALKRLEKTQSSGYSNLVDNEEKQ
jgi:hypothetical protein